MKRWTARVASPDVHALAEGPLWDGPRNRLLWVDIEAGAVYIGALDGDRSVTTICPAFVGSGLDRPLITTARSDGERNSAASSWPTSVQSACP